MTNSAESIYLGLARKWRSQTFEDLVGQEHVTRTIQNAIRSGRISHSYLFTGTRGVGKTSAARILSKALRCQPSNSSGVPCNKCVDCIEITSGRSIDVQEIDGASNNGVDAVRELRESAKFLPATGQYKIYIIDEVHMLTTAAFNALLKILEEPPSHLIFILATTDPQKIPATVLGRCQRYDFKRVSPQAIMDRMAHICKSEDVKIDDGALSILAREAEGSLRDALSLLDQVIATGDRHITVDNLTKALGLIDRQSIFQTLEAILKRNGLAALESAGQIHLYGYDLKLFARELLRSLRLLMVIQLLDTHKAPITAALEVSESDLQDFKKLIGLRSNEDLDMMFCILNQGQEDIARSMIPKTVLDVLLIKLAASEPLISVEAFEPKATTVSSTSFASTPTKPAVTATAVTTSATKSTFAAAAPATPVARATTNAFTPPPSLSSIPTSTVSAAPTSTAATASASAPASFSAAQWAQLVAQVKSSKPLLGTLLDHATFQKYEIDSAMAVITLGFSKEQSFYKEQLKQKTSQDALLPVMKEILKTAVRLEYVDVTVSRSLEDEDRIKKEQRKKERQQAVLQSEAIRAAQEVLGARIERLDITGDL